MCVFAIFADITSLIVTVNLNDYSEGQHTLEIVGLTQVPEILRTTVTFYGRLELLYVSTKQSTVNSDVAIYINGKISNFKVEYRAGTKRKPTRSRLLVHTIYATHNKFPPQVNQRHKPIQYRACVVDLLGLGIYYVWHILCVQAI